MKILFISDNFPPELNAPASRTFEHCKEWVRLGHKVTVVTCAPNFPRGEVLEGYKNRLFQREYMDGIEVVRVWSYLAPNQGMVRRTLDYLSFAFMASVASVARQFDTVITTSPQFFTNAVGVFLSIVRQKYWVLELRDLWPESIDAVGAMSNKRLLNWLEKLELYFYRRANLIIPVTKAFKESLVARGIPKEKIHVVTNGIDAHLFKGTRDVFPNLQSKRTQGKFLVGYVGTIGLAHCLDFILTSAVKLEKLAPDIFFVFFGDGAEKEKLLKLKEKRNLQNVEFFDPIPRKEVPRVLSGLDLGVVNLNRSKIFITVIPSKIFEFVAMRKPFLLGVDGEARRLVEQYDTGIFFAPEDEDDFLEKLLSIRRDAQRRSELSQNCELMSRDFDRRKLALTMISIIDSCSKGYRT